MLPKMSQKELKSMTALMIDLSGTIHIENQAVEGAVEAVDRLKARGIPHLFVTNTTKESQSSLHQRLKNMNFLIEKDEIFSSLSAAKRLIQQKNLRPMLFLEKDALSDFTEIPQEDPNAVVIGLAPNMFDYETLSKGFELLLSKPDSELIAIHKARYFKKSGGVMALGPGAFVTGLEYSSGKTATVVGKPDKTFFDSAFTELTRKFPNCQLTPETTLMIGDDVKDDVIGAQNSSYSGALVKTGKYREGDESGFQPNFIFDSFTKIVDSLIE